MTKALLDEYDAVQDRDGRAELRIGSLKELSEMAARSVGLPERAFLVAENRQMKTGRTTFWDGSRERAAFVPRDLEDLSGIVGGPGPALDEGGFGSGATSDGAATNGGEARTQVGPVGSDSVPQGPFGSGRVPEMSGLGPEDSSVEKPAKTPLPDPRTQIEGDSQTRGGEP